MNSERVNERGEMANQNNYAGFAGQAKVEGGRK
jgi:hypothetical protein